MEKLGFLAKSELLKLFEIVQRHKTGECMWCVCSARFPPVINVLGELLHGACARDGEAKRESEVAKRHKLLPETFKCICPLTARLYLASIISLSYSEGG